MPPTNWGVTKSPRAKINTKILPTTSPGKLIGKIIYLKACKGLQPKSKDASMIFFGILSKEVKVGIIIKGSKIITSVMITEFWFHKKKF